MTEVVKKLHIPDLPTFFPRNTWNPDFIQVHLLTYSIGAILQFKTFEDNCSWILNATAIHLAACWHVESLVHFLELDPDLCDTKTEVGFI